jgi:hypothetical protein
MYASVASPRGVSQFTHRVTLLGKLVCACLTLAACAGTAVFTRSSPTAAIRTTVWATELCDAGGGSCAVRALPLGETCSGLAHLQRSLQAFSILAVLVSAAALALHAVAGSPAGEPLKGIAKVVHGVACATTLICWALEAAWFNQTFCSAGFSLLSQGYQYSASFALVLCACVLQFVVLVYTAVFST